MAEKSLKKNSLVNLAKTIIGLIFPLITFPYASRVLGVENIGRVNFASSVMNYFVLIAGLGITNYAIREGAKIRDNPEQINKLCSELLIINIISTSIAYFGVLVIIQIPPFSSYQNLLLLFSTTIFFNIVGVNWLFNIFEEFVYITIRTIAFQVISLILLFIFVREKSDYSNYARILIFSSVGANIFNIFYSKKFVHFFAQGNYELKKHLKPVFIIFGMSLASTIYLNLDMTMLGIQSGDFEVGLYTAATKINKIVANIISSVCAVFLPRLAYYLETQRKKEFNELVNTAFYYILGFTIPAAAGIFILSKEILLIFSGPEFIGALPAMMIKAPNIIFSVINGFIAIQLFMPLNKEKKSLNATILGAIINCILNYFLIPIWGAAGAALATICAEGCVFLVCLCYLKGLYPLRRLFHETWKYVIGSSGILIWGVVIHRLNLGIIITTILIITIGGSMYFVILWLLKAQLISELQQNFIKRGIKL